MSSQLEAVVRQVRGALATQAQQIAQLQQVIMSLQSRPRSITEEIDQIPGRRVETRLVDEQTFDANDLGRRGTALTIVVSQDGPFVMTHYPLVCWRPSAPANATNVGAWLPIGSWPLPTQEITTASIVDISYELIDGGTGRQLQNGPCGPVLSRPDNFVPCAVPTLFAPNSTIQFVPTYNAIDFNGAVPPTQGTLHVALIGYRIVNL